MKCYYSKKTVNWKNDGLDVSLLPVDSLIDKWIEMGEELEWQAPMEGFYLYDTIDSDKRYIKIEMEDGNKPFYFTRKNIDIVMSQNEDKKYEVRWTYIIDWWYTLFIDCFNFLEIINPQVYIKRCLQSRYLNEETGVSKINFQKQFWLNNALPINITPSLVQNNYHSAEQLCEINDINDEDKYNFSYIKSEKKPLKAEPIEFSFPDLDYGQYKNGTTKNYNFKFTKTTTQDTWLFEMNVDANATPKFLGKWVNWYELRVKFNTGEQYGNWTFNNKGTTYTKADGWVKIENENTLLFHNTKGFMDHEVYGLHFNIPISLNLTVNSTTTGEDDITIKNIDFLNSSNNNKFAYILADIGAVKNAKAVQSTSFNYIIIPLLKTFSYTEKGIEKTIDEYNFRQSLFNTKNPDILLDDTNFIGAFEDTIPLSMILKTSKSLFYGFNNENVPIPFIITDDWNNKSFKIMSEKMNRFFPSDFSIWDAKNEPLLYNRQFFNLSLDNSVSSNNLFPLEIFEYPIYQDGEYYLEYNLVPSYSKKINYFLDISKYTPTADISNFNNNFEYSFSEPINMRFTAYANWLDSNMNTERTAYANLAAEKAIMERSIATSFISTITGGLTGGLTNGWSRTTSGGGSSFSGTSAAYSDYVRNQNSGTTGSNGFNNNVNTMNNGYSFNPLGVSGIGTNMIDYYTNNFNMGNKQGSGTSWSNSKGWSNGSSFGDGWNKGTRNSNNSNWFLNPAAIAGGALSTVGNFANSILGMFNLGAQFGIKQRNLDTTFANIKQTSSNLTSAGSYECISANTSGVNIKIKQLTEEQKKLVMSELYNFGYIYEGMTEFSNYNNRKYFNILQIDSSYNNYYLTDKLLQFLEKEYPIFCGEYYVNMFLDWMNTIKRYWKKEIDSNVPQENIEIIPPFVIPTFKIHLTDLFSKKQDIGNIGSTYETQQMIFDLMNRQPGFPDNEKIEYYQFYYAIYPNQRERVNFFSYYIYVKNEKSRFFTGTADMIEFTFTTTYRLPINYFIQPGSVSKQLSKESPPEIIVQSALEGLAPYGTGSVFDLELIKYTYSNSDKGDYWETTITISNGDYMLNGSQTKIIIYKKYNG